MKQTNIQEIRNLAITFLNLPVEPHEKFPILTSHPFTSAMHAAVSKNGKVRMVDLHDEKQAEEWRTYMKQSIETESLSRILLMMNTPYILTFLKYGKQHISKEDMGKYLRTHWQNIEAITTDVNCTAADIVSLFKYADRNTLMTKEQLEHLDSLPEQITVYRGVTSLNKKSKNAFSWTPDKGTAEWFANRFDTGTGEIWKITVPKKKILAYFDGKEEEVILNVNGLVNQIEVVKSPAWERYEELLGEELTCEEFRKLDLEFDLDPRDILPENQKTLNEWVSGWKKALETFRQN